MNLESLKMKTEELTPVIEQLVQEQLATGKYRSREEVPVRAMRQLAAEGTRAFAVKSQPSALEEEKGADTADLLVTSKKLQDAIKAADLAGAKDAEEPSPEEAELFEEMDEMANAFNNQQGSKPGELVFVFVAKISAADREKAMAEAFRSAKQDAAQLAKAADLELGPLRSLQGGEGIEAEDGADYRMLDNTPFGRAMRQQMVGHDHTDEAIGAGPGILLTLTNCRCCLSPRRCSPMSAQANGLGHGRQNSTEPQRGGPNRSTALPIQHHMMIPSSAAPSGLLISLVLPS